MKADAAIINGVCSYESFALTTGLVPTVTGWHKRLPKPLRVALVGAEVAWFIWHMLFEEESS